MTEFDNKVSQAISLFSENRIDILVNCAGVHGNQKFGIVSEATYDAVMNLELSNIDNTKWSFLYTLKSKRN